MFKRDYLSFACCLALLIGVSGGRKGEEEPPKMSKLVAVDFEVFGRVQGVFFRKYTQKQGKELGLNGWCMNTQGGTVVGRLEGDKAKVEEMKRWLQYKGSPESAIDKAELRNEAEISQPSISGFQIKK